MLQVYKTAARVAVSDATRADLWGESGSGKEARRARHPPGLPARQRALRHRRLRGAVRGRAARERAVRAFQGSLHRRPGRPARRLFEEASGGTLLLDEIGNVSTKLQAQLLRVLQEGEIRPVGSNDSVAVNVRVVAATNRDLAQAVQEGTFREDLFYRLNVVTIRNIPPLRERVEDIPLLAEHFVHKHGRTETASLSAEARAILSAYRWPGNVRELENAIARALALNPSGVILPEDLPAHVRSPQPGKEGQKTTSQLWADRPTLEVLERRYAELVLQECAGNKSKAADQLGIDRKTLGRLLASDAPKS